MLKKFVLEVESKEDVKEKLKEGLVKAFESEGVKVNVEDGEELSEGERKKREDEQKNKEVKDRKIEELTQQFEAVSKLQGDKDKQISELNAKILALEKERDALKTSEEVSIEEKDSAIKELNEYKKNAKIESIKTFVKNSIADGKVLPKDENIIVALMEQLDDKAVVKFAKDDGQEESVSLVDTLRNFISNQPKIVKFEEISPNVPHKIYEDKVNIGGQLYDVENLELVQKAEKYAQENSMPFDVAVIEVSKNQ